MVGLGMERRRRTVRRYCDEPDRCRYVSLFSFSDVPGYLLPACAPFCAQALVYMSVGRTGGVDVWNDMVVVLFAGRRLCAVFTDVTAFVTYSQVYRHLMSFAL